MELSDVKTLAERIRAEVGKAIVGQQDTVDLMLTALFSGGHILLEGAPGTGKTLLAQALAASLTLDFGRIQFTPDLMPGDIVGTNLFNFQTSTFSIVRGPIFCDLLLADEINRTPPKTQAALLEAMQERKVTLDGKTHALNPRFMVVATENPIEQQGTYPLPEAQLDRFLFKQVMGYPEEAQERAIVAAMGTNVSMPNPAELGVTAVAGGATISSAIAAVGTVRLTDAIVEYIVALVRETRNAADIAHGASPRSGANLAAAARAYATLQGRDYVIPDDVKTLLLPALRHRLVLSAAAEIDGRRVDDVIATIIERVPAPR
ncbi:MAG TPA: MoxR family ATPase [Rhizomicrobium sp.]|jgi:MoxR-like ATPase|nr:MoxR family ATPase [Rhizomicrobium sp.]